MTQDLLTKWLEESDENARLFAQEGLIFDVTESIYEMLEKQGKSKAELAASLGRSKAYVTQLLNGSRNMTLRTLADIAFALGVTASVQLKQRDTFHQWEKVETAHHVKVPRRLLSDVSIIAANGAWSDSLPLRQGAM